MLVANRVRLALGVALVIAGCDAFVNGASAAQFVGAVRAARVRQLLASVSPKP
jgi:hypothetical protein